MTAAWDQTTFNSVLDSYLAVTSRTLSSALNTKAYYIARGAARVTDKVAVATIEAQLGKIISVERISKKGTKYNRKSLQLTMGRDSRAPLAGLIINKRRGQAGEPGLQGRDMRDAIKRLLGARKKSVAFIASGWIPAIKTLARYAEKVGGAPSDLETGKQFGAKKGMADPAKAGNKMIARIINSAMGKTANSRAAHAKHGSRGLQRAFDAETASMLQYLRDRLDTPTKTANRRLL